MEVRRAQTQFNPRETSKSRRGFTSAGNKTHGSINRNTTKHRTIRNRSNTQYGRTKKINDKQRRDAHYKDLTSRTHKNESTKKSKSTETKKPPDSRTLDRTTKTTPTEVKSSTNPEPKKTSQQSNRATSITLKTTKTDEKDVADSTPTTSTRKEENESIEATRIDNNVESKLSEDENIEENIAPNGGTSDTALSDNASFSDSIAQKSISKRKKKSKSNPSHPITLKKSLKHKMYEAGIQMVSDAAVEAITEYATRDVKKLIKASMVFNNGRTHCLSEKNVTDANHYLDGTYEAYKLKYRPTHTSKKKRGSGGGGFVKLKSKIQDQSIDNKTAEDCEEPAPSGGKNTKKRKLPEEYRDNHAKSKKQKTKETVNNSDSESDSDVESASSHLSDSESDSETD